MITRIELQLMQTEIKELPRIRKALERIADALEKGNSDAEQ